ncbi:MAG: hypothetical protein N2260_02450 [Syntrophobacterales bacterium]|nr:hypothetical protein [Syntrophobacterales bacterium]
MRWSLITALVILIFTSTTLASDIVITLTSDNTISVPYCWKKGDQIKFDSPGGVVGLSMAYIKAIEERPIHSDLDFQYLISNAIDRPSKEPLAILKDFLAKKRGVSVRFKERISQKSSSSPLKTPSTSDERLISPATKVFESYTQAMKDAKGSSILIGVFVNSREELEGRKCSVKLLDLDKKIIAQEPMRVIGLYVSEEDRTKNRISPFFYLIYGTVTANIEFWSYDVVCEII